MNITKAQKIIFDELISGGHVRKFEVDKDNVFITPDGFRGFVLPYTSIQVNLDRIATLKTIDFSSVVKEENLCHLTKELVLQEHPKAYLRKLKKGDTNIYFNQKYMECFQNPKFYNASSTGMIVVTEDISATRINQVVGIIMPTRVVEDHFA